MLITWILLLKSALDSLWFSFLCWDRYLIASHTTDYQHPMLFLNTLAAIVLVIAKFPNMHKVRIFGINADKWVGYASGRCWFNLLKSLISFTCSGKKPLYSNQNWEDFQIYIMFCANCFSSFLVIEEKIFVLSYLCTVEKVYVSGLSWCCYQLIAYFDIAIIFTLKLKKWKVILD